MTKNYPQILYFSQIGSSTITKSLCNAIFRKMFIHLYEIAMPNNKIIQIEHKHH